MFGISTIDGRYKNYMENLKNYFSEFAFIRYRIKIEIEYFIELSKIIPELNINIDINLLKNIYLKFNEDDFKKIKNIEKNINHDVKSIEYFIREKLITLGLSKKNTLFVHFGLTSQDINNNAICLSIKEFLLDEYNIYLNKLLDKLNNLCINYRNNIMLAFTHGQPAVPTTIGKELKVFFYRLSLQFDTLKKIEIYGKLGGAVGNLNAHVYCYPEINWINFANKFLNLFNLKRSEFTTQISNYDNYCEIFDCLKRINSILVDFCQDIWLYISKEYFLLKINENEVGSSTMPHKINPINFENAEGNLLLANSLLEFMSRNLPISKLQRDLKDSTILRNIGLIFGYIQISFINIVNGFNKLKLNKKKIQYDLNQNLHVLAEAEQLNLKKKGIDGYELLKNKTRCKKKKFKTNINFTDYIGYANSFN